MHQLRYFAKVAELGHVTRAAEACLVSQPSLSQQIAKLERELGRPLLERHGRGVRLTDAGRQFKEYADQILALTEEARRRVADDPDTGRLSVAAIPTVAPDLLPGVLVRFTGECPKAQLDVMEVTTEEVLKALTTGEADIGVLALPVPGGAVRTEPLYTEELVAVLPARHPLADRPRLSMRELAKEPFVLLHEAHCLTGRTLGVCAQHGVSPIVTARIHQMSTILELVGLGQGVSLVPAGAATRHAGGKVVFRSLAGPRPTRTVALAYSPLRFQSKLFKRFVACLKEQTRRQ